MSKHNFPHVSKGSGRDLGVWLLLACLFLCGTLQAQKRIPGQVLRADNAQPIFGVTVALFGGDGVMVASTATDSLGNFHLIVPSRSADLHSALYLKTSALGFHEKMLPLSNGEARRDSIKITLHPYSQELDAIVIEGGSLRTRSRENPGLQLIQAVIQHKPQNRSQNLAYIRFQRYEKIMMAVSGLPKMVASNPLFKKYDFVFDNVDTSLVKGKALLPVYLEEKIADEWRGARVNGTRTHLKALRKTELDQRFVNNKNIQTIISHLHSEMDLYANTMLVLSRPFMSPIANGAHLFYRYHINDTTSFNDGRYVELAFEPRNLEDRLFTGRMWISLDGKYAVRKAELAIGPRSNINFVNDLDLCFEYVPHPSGNFLPTLVEIKMNFGVQGAKRGMFSHWVIHYTNPTLGEAPPKELFGDLDLVQDPNAEQRSPVFWHLNRPFQLSQAEATTYQNVDSLQRNKDFLRTLSWVSLFMTSYKNVGPFEVGPLEYAYSFNDLEGSRVRIGGRTNRLFSDRFYGEAYGAYGFFDEKWKYYLGAAHTLNGRRIAEYPAHYVQVVWQADAREPGHRLDFLNGDAFFRSFRKSTQNKWIYHEQFKLNHIFEFGNHLRLQSSFTNHWQRPAAELVFLRAFDQEQVSSMKTTELGLNLRWGPNEEYFQRNLHRSYIVNRFPVFNLRYEAGLKGPLGGEFSYHKLRFDASKRWYYSLIGFSDVAFGAGYLFGSVPFPLLDIPMANQSYLIAADSYSLMRDLEFVSDKYVKFAWEHRFQGFFLNKVPLLKNLKIRELVRFNMYYGGLSQRNRPNAGSDLFLFPADKEGRPITFALENKPYMELSVGFENIFNLVRIEYIKRLSYLHLPNADKGGLHISLKFGF